MKMVNHAKIFLGFDGYIDYVIKLFRDRNTDGGEYFGTLGEYGDFIRSKENKSFSLDADFIDKKIGGNMPNMAHSLSQLGYQSICIGALGYPDLHPLFGNMDSNCELFSVSEPGYSYAYEFADGKMMIADNTAINQLNFAVMEDVLGLEQMISIFKSCDAFAFLNWGEMKHSNDIWKNTLTKILAACDFSSKRWLLIDFSDLSYKTKDEVDQMLILLGEFARYFKIALSLNKNELDLLTDHLLPQTKFETDEAAALAIRPYFQTDEFVIHLLDRSLYMYEGEIVSMEKEVIANPKLITGGGDNFNAGLLSGLIRNLSISDAIKLASEISVQYVRDGVVTEQITV